EINTKALEKYPAIPEVLAPITAKLDNAIAQELNSKVAVQGQDPHTVALEWMLAEGFVKD
ncbi:glycine betaine ABC transporter substrate-binding protein, partial [Streptomyces sp. PGLac3x]